jgi:hypothetical protein
MLDKDTLKKEAIKIADIIRNFFKGNQNRATQSYTAFKSLHYRRIYDQINPNNCSTPEKAFATMNKLLGEKSLFEQLEYQYEQSIKEDN